MPQMNVLPDWKATYPNDAKVQKSPVGTVNPITNAVWTSAAGPTTYTTANPHGLVVGAAVEISGMNPSTYNGTFTTIAGTAGSSIVVAMASNPGALVSNGFAYYKNLTVNMPATAVPNKPQWTGTQ